MLKSVSVPSDDVLLPISAIYAEVGVLQTLLANQTLCLFVVNSALCDNSTDCHAVHERINVKRIAKVFKKLGKVEDRLYAPLCVHRNRRRCGQQFFRDDLSKIFDCIC